MMMEYLIAIIVAIFGSTGFWTVVGQKTSKRNEMMKEINELKNSFIDFKHDVEEKDAKATRSRIIAFSDSLVAGDKRSKDAYDNILVDCDDYEKFCSSHKDFKNSIAEASISKIKSHYLHDDFLQI